MLIAIALMADAVLGVVGGMPSKTSSNEEHIGIERDFDREVGAYGRLGGGIDLEYMHVIDDECYGFNALRSDVFASAAFDLYDPASPRVHVLVGPRAGVVWMHEKPYCSSATLANEVFAWDVAAVAALEVDHLRVQLAIGELAFPLGPLEVSVGVGYRF